MSRIRITYALIILLLLSCEKNKDDLNYIATQNFKIIVFEDLFDVYLIQDTISYIETRNIVENGLSLKYNDSTLTLSLNNLSGLFSMKEKPELYLHVDTLRKIIIQEPCNLYSVNYLTQFETVIWATADLQEIHLKINNNRLFFKTSYNTHCDFYAEGKTDYMEIWPYSASNIYLENLVCTNAIIKNYSFGILNFDVTNNIDILNNEKCIINLYGQPNSINIIEKTKDFSLNIIDK